MNRSRYWFVIGMAALVQVRVAMAQQPGLAAGIVPVVPGVTVNVLRETSITADISYCASVPAPVECQLAHSTAWLGGQPLSPIGVDAAGSFYDIPDASGGGLVGLPDGDGGNLRRGRRDGVTQYMGFVYRQKCLDPPGCTRRAFYARATPFYLDVTNGRIIIVSGASIRSEPGDQEIDYRVGLVEIAGLPQLLDTLLTFIPGGQLTALVPAHPDGFGTANALQVWTGEVRSMPDWSRAEPLTCDAATSPAPGQLVAIADPLPDPAVGHARYYLTASVNGPDRRLGRQYVNGGFSARNPATLPVCAP
jgi:hypothetical protein